MASNALACITLIDQEGGKFLNDLMLILVELLLLLGQCLDVLVHLLGQVGSRSCCEVALVSQSHHLRCYRFGCIIVRIVGGKRIKCILLEWKGRGRGCTPDGPRWGPMH